MAVDGDIACAEPKEQLLDRFGLRLTTQSQECREAVNEYYEAVLAYKPFAAWTAAERAMDADPSCPMAWVLAADYAFCKGDVARATDLLRTVQAKAEESAAESWALREKSYLQAWTKWAVDGDPAGCFEVLVSVVDAHPSDLFAVKRGQIMGLILGDGTKIHLIVGNAATKTLTSPPPKYLHGMWAFGLEQCGQYEEAEQKAREGLAFEAELGADAWLDHGLAHALYFQGEDMMDDAIEFLKSRSPTWNSTALHPFLYTHNWWHLALLYCERRDYTNSLKIFDERLWADSDSEMRVDPQVQLNALNLLWRFETRGQSEAAQARWAKVLEGCEGLTLPAQGAKAEKAPQQHCDLLLDILLVRGLCTRSAQNPKALDTFLAAISAHGQGLATSAGGANGRAGTYMAVATHIADLFRNDQSETGMPLRHSKARKELAALRESWGSLGGSEEQRSVLLEATEGQPVVCGEVQPNYDTLFF